MDRDRATFPAGACGGACTARRASADRTWTTGGRWRGAAPTDARTASAAACLSPSPRCESSTRAPKTSSRAWPSGARRAASASSAPRRTRYRPRSRCRSARSSARASSPTRRGVATTSAQPPQFWLWRFRMKACCTVRAARCDSGQTSDSRRSATSLHVSRVASSHGLDPTCCSSEASAPATVATTAASLTFMMSSSSFRAP
mmetsp:Transcript_20162/g.60119  ORF Transcript_20162/g.60119 Transcript_20162/m.60119 type:complete len:202 (-) Transcript_20162:547-1152(-)